MSRYKSIFIDDDIESINNFKKMISHFFSHEVEITDTFTSSYEALNKINDIETDIIFIDIEMPEINGLEFIHLLPKKLQRKVVVVSAFEQYAINAIKYNIAYYLLKPLSVSEFKKCLSKISNDIAQQEQQLLKQNNQTVIIKTTNKTYFFDTKSIKCIEAKRGNSLIFYKDEIVIISKNLKQIEEVLPLHIFYKVHRSHIINIYFVKEVTKSNFIILNDDTEIEMSKKKKTELLTHFSGI